MPTNDRLLVTDEVKVFLITEEKRELTNFYVEKIDGIKKTLAVYTTFYGSILFDFPQDSVLEFYHSECMTCEQFLIIRATKCNIAETWIADLIPYNRDADLIFVSAIIQAEEVEILNGRGD